ncbi:hypothetical protein ABZ865_33885 [Streptomyces sp. NPDC047085]|uniref:hypothetical protein n=1 Tax=Streptomyces sp. NPDC047085 TaxID=3155140 RepID=UPI0033F48AF8
MNAAPSQTPASASETSDEELAQRAAEVATSWVSADISLSKEQEWDLVALQHAGSSQGEMHAFDRICAWQRQLVQRLAAAGDSAEGRDCAAEARSEAVSQMRDMFLSGIRSAEWLNKTRIHPVDPRAELRALISRSR